MNRESLENWRHARIRHGAARTRLDLWHRPGDERCADAMAAYYAGQLPGLEQIRSSPATQVHWGRLHDSGPICYFKRFLIRDWSDHFKHVIFPSRARRALLAGIQIESLGFHTPRSVCLLEARRSGCVTDSVLVTEEVAGATHIFGWLNWPEWGVACDWKRKQELIRAFGRETGKWHAAGLYHGDMGLGNIMATASADGFRFYWLDNERTRRFRRLPHRLRVKNLAQLNTDRPGFTRTDRLRFWKSYVEACALPPQTQERLRRDVNRLTQTRVMKGSRSSQVSQPSS